ncbi:hypothetical protein CERZMDRAFT_93165 [Cercospora zeae-maydis SCOH1-5]|uniref:Uncharacterized protein n=1 Tax=Cercospora zeae-maydis SCOH1-5 TaxID=717836 RepID=A0A6A6FUE1_9PEZI|nr:hypothetical protein CERZMDRAFT_93165 [Cercospora zeae-maydis SCOH1-5]
MADTQFDHPQPAGLTFGQKMRAMFCCGEYDEEYESPRRSIQIGMPTDFRREDVNIAGLPDEEAAEIREKSRRDAQRMFHNLRPLSSSPSGTFAERPVQPEFPSYEQFTQPRAAPTPGSSPIHPSSPGFGTNPRQPPSPGGIRNANRVSGFYGSDSLYVNHYDSHTSPPPLPPKNNNGPTTFDRVKAHSRKISDSFRSSKNNNNHGNGPSPFDDESHVEMRHLMSPSNNSKTQISTTIRGGADGKNSDDSFGQTSESDDRGSYQRYDSGLSHKGSGDHRI